MVGLFVLDGFGVVWGCCYLWVFSSLFNLCCECGFVCVLFELGFVWFC